MSNRAGSLEIVVTIFFDNTHYPNVGRFVRDKTLVYWRDIVTMAGSVRKVFADYGVDTQPTLRVISNLQPPKAIRRTLDLFDVVITSIPYHFKLPEGWFHSFGGAFYLFDSMIYILEQTAAGLVIFVDPDVLWVDDPRPVLRQLEQDGYLILSIDYYTDSNVNGLSRWDLKELFTLWGPGQAEAVPVYYGGELYGFDRKTLKVVVDEVRSVWPKVLSMQGHPLKPNTEEHIMNYVLWKMGIRERGNANRFAKRIWTAHSFCNVDGSEMDLAIWHLPGEKNIGLKRLSRRVANPNSPFWKLRGDDYKRFLARMVGIEPTLKRSLENAARRIVRGLLDAVQSKSRTV